MGNKINKINKLLELKCIYTSSKHQTVGLQLQYSFNSEMLMA